MKTPSMKPVIGVVADVHAGGKHTAHTVHQKYLDAITAGAGGIALILPALIDRPGAAWTDPADLTAALTLLDGLFLTGATSNIEPAQYGAPLHDALSPADPARDHVSLSLVQRAAASGLPILGICRGIQEINVALGGTLHQKIHEVPGLDDHREDTDLPLAVQYGPAHEVTFAPGGLLHLCSGMDSAIVNSVHGQGIDRVAPGLAVEATAPDGLVEAVRKDHTDDFLLGVQWHPEWEFRENPLSMAIFRAFGTAARAFKASRKEVVLF